MVKDLIKVATKLDSLGLTREASYLDSLIRKIAAEGSDDPDYDYAMSLKSDDEDPDYNDHMKKIKIVMERTGLSEIEAEELVDRVEMADEMEDDSGPISYNPHLHGTPSYEMDAESIHEGIDSDRELEEMYPTVTSFRRSSSNRSGMRKRS
jgi:hypothetical protein